MTGTDVTISEFLAGLGIVGDEALAAAREAIEQAGLTNPRKVRIAGRKRGAALAAISARYAPCCGRGSCVALLRAQPRPLLSATAQLCEACRGSANRAALERMGEALLGSGVRRVLVVGGSPGVRTELQSLAAGLTARVTLVDATKRMTGNRAKALVDSHDLVVIWASTELPHKVSNLFNIDASKTLTVPRRGIEALAEAVTRRVRGR